jgi:phosphatidylinositol alpha-1,6-mannosyltransferase
MSNLIGSRFNLLSFDYPPSDGGIARLCSKLAMELANEGIEIRVTTHRRSVGAGGPQPPSVPTITVPSVRPIRELTAAMKLRSQPKVPVIVAAWYPEGVVAKLAGAEQLVVMAHGAEIFPPRDHWRRWWWPAFSRRVFESASAVVANSRYTVNLVRSLAPRSKVDAVPLAVDEKEFSPGNQSEARRRWGFSNTSAVLLSVSRIHRYKGHDTVLHAIAALPAEHRKSILYVVAGKGTAEEELRRIVCSLGVADAVRWLGFVPDEQLPSLYRAADMFVLCTREDPKARAVEGFGLAFLEAQACGVPVIGADSGGIPDAVEHGNGGWLVPPDDPEALSRLLSHLVVSPEEVRKMGGFARKRVIEGFTWRQYSSRFIAALRRQGVIGDG